MDALITAFTGQGLAGIVIGALFFSLWMYIKSADKRFYEQSERHSEERNLWRDSYDKNTEMLRVLSSKKCGG